MTRQSTKKGKNRKYDQEGIFTERQTNIVQNCPRERVNGPNLKKAFFGSKGQKMEIFKIGPN